jgi:zinc D-Ala-D-Ala carboxypeptidase
VKRREILTGLLAGTGFAAANGYLWQQAVDIAPEEFGDDALASTDFSQPLQLDPETDSESFTPAPTSELDKVRYFENEFNDDIFLPESEQSLLVSVLLRMERVQRITGHGNYNLLGFDDMIKVARNYNSVGAFEKAELEFMEKVFFTEASEYGFLGDKVTNNLTESIKKSDTLKIPYSGHYLFKNESLAYYEKLKKDVGSSIILTSGIRSNVKQMHLFLAKCNKSSFNLSKASRSLAPPGHSYHGIGDFDVGKVGYGVANFTDEFAKTDEFKRMLDLGYVQIRYTEDNRLGVRFEPWHIKVV